MAKGNMKVMAKFNLLKPLLEKAMEYQNKGYGTVFIDIHGHITNLEIDIHPFGWCSQNGAEYTFNINISNESFSEVKVGYIIQEIQDLMDNSVTAEDYEEKQRLIKEDSDRKKYEELKKKFG